ncbi:MAG: preprotein translocase subunit SecG [Lentisphaerae bacterium GWF2_44_16]|nr:MAG: preprotein translocase subunit SecG [Lentisphaerae bacterium GWF2_44_16]
MEVLTIVLYTLVVIVAILLIGLVLIQQSKGGGFGSAFGGVGESVFGAHAGSHLTKLTVILTTFFFVLILTLAIITGHRDKPKSIVETETNVKSTATQNLPLKEIETKLPVQSAPAAVTDKTDVKNKSIDKKTTTDGKLPAEIPVKK